MLEKTKHQRVFEALQEKGVDQPCARCNGLKFEVLDTTNIGIEQGKRGFYQTENVLPVAITLCSNCGFVCMHSLSVLGLSIGASGSE
jgi:hypothetical protein